MPSRKQRRRREKTFRHEYDLVAYDDEGNELDAGELRREKEQDKEKARPAAAKGKAAPRRAPRPVPPPTWRRAVRRGGLMGAVFFLLMSTLFKAPLPISLIYSLALIPFTYGMDWFTHRTYVRRTSKPS
jgi:hypothetical protein